MTTELAIILGGINVFVAGYLKVLHSSAGKAFDKLEKRVDYLEKNTVGKEQLDTALKSHFDGTNERLLAIERVLDKIIVIKVKS